MCGRFSLSAPAETVTQQFGVGKEGRLTRRYNIAPSQPVAAVRVLPDLTNRELALLQWGLLPSWANDTAIAYKLINARAETAANKPAFRSAFRLRRCLIPADGFYEWQRRRGSTQPFHIRLRDGGLFAFAGLWEHWEKPGQPAVESCTILTTEANEAVKPFHDRMPVLLPVEAYDAWLDPKEHRPEQLLQLLTPISAELLEAIPVSTVVNNARHETADCIKPMSQGKLFSDYEAS